jgi:hypothetical protein
MNPLANFGSFFGLDGVIVLLFLGLVAVAVVIGAILGFSHLARSGVANAASVPAGFVAIASERICKECGTLVSPTTRITCADCGGRLISATSPMGAELRQRYHKP